MALTEIWGASTQHEGAGTAKLLALGSTCRETTFPRAARAQGGFGGLSYVSPFLSLEQNPVGISKTNGESKRGSMLLKDFLLEAEKMWFIMIIQGR